MIKLSRPVLTLLSFNAIILSVALYFLLFLDVSAETDANKPPLVEQSVNVNAPIERPEVNYTLLLDRALFHETRKKIEVPVEAPPPPLPEREERRAVPSSSFKLLGVVFHEDGSSVAYIKNTSANKDLNLTVNEEFEGWKILAINKNSIIISRGGQQSTLHLIKK